MKPNAHRRRNTKMVCTHLNMLNILLRNTEHEITPLGFVVGNMKRRSDRKITHLLR